MSLKFNSVSKEFLEAIKDNPKKGTSPYDTVADVVRIEGNTAWVHIAGGVDETPVLKTIDCKEGDVVQIRVGGGTAWITGNSTAPPTDDTKANVAYNYAEIAIADALKARESAENAERDAERAYVAANSAEEQAQRAQTAADNAQDSANEATRQAGIATTNANEAIRQAGVATTNANEAIRQAGIAKTSADNAMASAISANNSANNALTQLSTVEDVVNVLNWITEHGTYKASTDTEVVAGKFYFTRTGSGTTADPYVYTVVTNPTGNPSTNHYYELDSVDEAISNYVSTHLALTDDGLFLVKDGSGYKLKLTNYGEYIIAPNGTVVNQMTADGNIIRATNGTVIAHLGYGEGASESGTATAPYYTFGTRVSSVAFGNYSVVEGKSNDATASCAHAEGSFTEASGANSHAEGYTTSAYGYSSHAEGYETEANHYSHAEGIRTEASGLRGCHAEGQETESSGEASHSEGYQTVASAFSSHAEGNGTEASGANSHAEGTTTVASEIASHAEGGYTQANGRYSHSQNVGTIANGDYQTALGQYNIADTTNAVIIGNGSNDSNRSNVLTVDWNGNVNIASGAKYKINGNNLSASDVGALPASTTIPSKTSQLTNDSGFVTTDEKLKIGAVANNTTNTTYYPILATNSTTAATRYYDSTGIHYNNVNGSTTVVGRAELVLGNSTASGSANNKKGVISLYSSTSTYGYFTTADLTAQRTYTFPDKTGTVALTSDIPTDSDEKLTIEQVLDSTSTTYTYYPILALKATTNGIRQIDETGFKLNNRKGSADNAGYEELIIGNSTAEGTEGNKRGWISMYGRGDKYVRIYVGTLTANREIALPNKGGTIALTSDIPSNTKTTFTPTNGTAYSNYGNCYYEKYGDVVHVHVGISGLTTGTATTVYTLPEGYRPSSPVFAHGTGGSWNNIGYMEISTAGEVTVRSQGTYCGADITFMV